MDNVRVPKNGWVFVCDGMRALMLRNDGDINVPVLTTVGSFTESHPPTRQLGSDRPGRVFQSNGTARSAKGDADLHDEEETAFLKRMAEEMAKVVKSHDVTSLVVVAPPRALGVLRTSFAAPVKSVVTAEIAKDLTKMPTGEIAQYLSW